MRPLSPIPTRGHRALRWAPYFGVLLSALCSCTSRPAQPHGVRAPMFLNPPEATAVSAPPTRLSMVMGTTHGEAVALAAAHVQTLYQLDADAFHQRFYVDSMQEYDSEYHCTFRDRSLQFAEGEYMCCVGFEHVIVSKLLKTVTVESGP